MEYRQFNRESMFRPLGFPQRSAAFRPQPDPPVAGHHSIPAPLPSSPASCPSSVLRQPRWSFEPGLAAQASIQIKVTWRPVSPSRRCEKYLSAAE